MVNPCDATSTLLPCRPPRGGPRDGFDGTLGIHFMPASALDPPTYAGIAMIRPRGLLVAGIVRPQQGRLLRQARVALGVQPKRLLYQVDRGLDVEPAGRDDVLLRQEQERRPGHGCER